MGTLIHTKEAIACRFEAYGRFFVKDNVVVEIRENAGFVAKTALIDQRNGTYLRKVMINTDFDKKLGKEITDPARREFHMLGLEAHELLHQILTPFDEISKRERRLPASERKNYHRTHNLCQDYWIEAASPVIFAGAILAALISTIAFSYEAAPNLETLSSSDGNHIASEVFNALIMVGDRGPVKGHFSCPEAKSVFDRVIPLFEQIGNENNAIRVVDLSDEIFAILRPYFAAERDSRINERSEMPEGRGNGSDRPEATPKVKIKKPAPEPEPEPESDEEEGDESGEEREGEEEVEDNAGEEQTDEESGNSEEGDTSDEDETSDEGDSSDTSEVESAADQNDSSDASSDNETPEQDETEDELDEDGSGDESGEEEAEEESVSEGDGESPDDSDTDDNAPEGASDGDTEEEDNSVDKDDESESDSSAGGSGNDEGEDGVDNELDDDVDDESEDEADDSETEGDTTEDEESEEDTSEEDQSSDTTDDGDETADDEADESDEFDDESDNEESDDVTSKDDADTSKDDSENSDTTVDEDAADQDECDRETSDDEGNCAEEYDDGCEDGDYTDPMDADVPETPEPDPFELTEDQIREAMEDTARDLDREQTELERKQAEENQDQDMPSGGDVKHEMAGSGDPWLYNRLLQKCQIPISVLEKKLKAIIKGDRGGKQYASTGGHISVKRLASGELKKDIKINRTAPKQCEDMQVHLLVDESGSMGGEKEKAARECAIILYEAFERLGIKVAVTGFTTDGYDIISTHYTTEITPDNAKVALTNISSWDCNCDAHNIAAEVEDMLQRRASHRLLVVISDGDPCYYDCDPKTPEEMVRDAVIDARSRGIDIMAVAIYPNNKLKYAGMYGKDFVWVYDINDLVPQVIKVMADVVRRWRR